MAIEKSDVARYIDQKFGVRVGQTVHFNIGNIGAPGVGSAGVFTPAAAAYFGQVNVERDVTIRACHLHLIDGGSNTGTLTVEVWRKRLGVYTRLVILSVVNPPDDAFDGAVPAGDSLADLKAGDYLFAQVTAATAVTGGGANGLTVDIHFAEEEY